MTYQELHALFARAHLNPTRSAPNVIRATCLVCRTRSLYARQSAHTAEWQLRCNDGCPPPAVSKSLRPVLELIEVDRVARSGQDRHGQSDPDVGIAAAPIPLTPAGQPNAPVAWSMPLASQPAARPVLPLAPTSQPHNPPSEVESAAQIPQHRPPGIPQSPTTSLAAEPQPAVVLAQPATPHGSASPLSLDQARAALRQFELVLLDSNGELPPFPTELLSPWMVAYCTPLTATLQVTPDLPGAFGLSVVSAAVASKFAVSANRDWVEPVNLFVAVVAGSGEKKTPVVKALAKPLQDYERDLAKRDADRRLIGDDATPEALARLLTENPGFAVITSEGGEILSNVIGGRYSKGMANVGPLLRGYDCEPLVVDRIGRPPDRTERACLTLGLTMQPNVASDLMTNATADGRGLLGRFLYSWSPSLAGMRNPDPPLILEGLKANFGTHMHALLVEGIPSSRQASRAPRLLTLSPGASTMHLQFRAWLEPQRGAGGELDHLAPWIYKSEGHVLRLAGILHLGDQAGRLVNGEPITDVIEAGAMDRARQLWYRYFLPHAAAAFAEMGGSDPATSDAKYILEWIKRRNLCQFSGRDAQQATRSRYRKKSKGDAQQTLAMALHRLIETRHIAILPPQQTPPRTGRPHSPIYVVNPRFTARVREKRAK